MSKRHTWYDPDFNEHTFTTRQEAYDWAHGCVLDTTPVQFVDADCIPSTTVCLRVVGGVGVWECEFAGYLFSDGVPEGTTETDPIADGEPDTDMCDFVESFATMLDDAAALGLPDRCAQLASMCRRLAQAADARASGVAHRTNGAIGQAQHHEDESESYLDQARKAQCPS